MSNNLHPDENGKLEDIWGDVRACEKVPEIATLPSPESGYDGCHDTFPRGQGGSRQATNPILPQNNSAKQTEI